MGFTITRWKGRSVGVHRNRVAWVDNEGQSKNPLIQRDDDLKQDSVSLPLSIDQVLGYEMWNTRIL